jgi:hypothetical protein
MKSEEVQMILNEILLEQKQVNEKLSSFTSIMMDIHEKEVTADLNQKMEILSEKARMLQMSCSTISEQLSMSLNEIKDLIYAIQYYQHQLTIPFKQGLVHHVHKILIFALVSFLMNIILVFWLYKVLH